MTMQTEIKFFRGNVANLPLLPEGMPAFALDTGQLFIGNGFVNVAIGAPYTSVSNTWTAEQIFIAPTSGVAITARAAAASPSSIQRWQNSAGSTVARIDPLGNFSNVATPTTGYPNTIEATTFIAANNVGYLSKTNGGSESTLIRQDASNVTEIFCVHDFKLNGGATVPLRITDSAVSGDGMVNIKNDTWANSVTLAVQTYSGNTHAIQTWRDGSGAVLCSIAADGLFFPVQAPTASAPTYVKGAIYFDTTLNKLMVGGATGWETITSI
jgi:hypothetical protein